MGVFAGRSYQKITQQEKPNFMTRATYAAVLLHSPWAAAKMMDIPGSTLRNRVENYAKYVKELAKQTSLPNLLLREKLKPAETAYLDAPARHSVHFFAFSIFEYLIMTIGSPFAIFEPWIWRRLGPVPLVVFELWCYSVLDVGKLYQTEAF